MAIYEFLDMIDHDTLCHRLSRDGDLSYSLRTRFIRPSDFHHFPFGPFPPLVLDINTFSFLVRRTEGTKSQDGLPIGVHTRRRGGIGWRGAFIAMHCYFAVS